MKAEVVRGDGAARVALDAHRVTTRLGPAAVDTAVGLTSVVNRAYSIAVIAFLYQATHSASVVATAAASRYLAGLLAGSFAFVAVERVRPKRLLLSVNLASAALLFACAHEVRLGVGAAVVIVLSSLVRATMAPLPAGTAALLPALLRGRDLAHWARRQNAIDKLALLVGPAFGGALLLVVSPGAELEIVGGLLLAAVAATLMVPDVPVAKRRSRRIRAAASSRQAHEVAGTVVWFAAFSVLAGFLYGTDTVLFAVLAHQRYHLGDSGYGLFFACLGAGGLLATVVSNRLASRPALAPLLLGALWLYGLPTAVLAAFGGTAVALPMEVVRGAGALLVDILAVTGLQRVLLPRSIPFVTGSLTAVVSGAVAAGALLTPVLLSGLGLRWTLAAAGSVLPVVSVAFLPRLRAVDAALTERSRELAPRTALLQRLGLLAGISRPTLEMLAADLTEIAVPSGTVVIREGEESDDLFVIVDGRADASAQGDRAESTVVSTMGAGDWFGEIAALTGAPRTATVTTTEASRLYRISAQDFRAALEQLPPSPALLDGAAARLDLTHPAQRLADLAAR